MSRRLRKNSDFLRVLAKATPKQYKGLIDGANKDLIHAVCECATNCLNGNIPLTPRQKKRLAPYKKNLRHLANKKVRFQDKRKVIQKGGFLGALLKPIIQTLGSLLLELKKKWSMSRKWC